MKMLLTEDNDMIQAISAGMRAGDPRGEVRCTSG
jgi:hypothetical protein